MGDSKNKTIRKNRLENGSFLFVLAVLVVIAAIVALGLQLVNRSNTTAPSVSVTSACQSSDLDLAIGPSTGTAGTIYVDAVFTNQSQHTCTVRGYPTVSLAAGTHNTMIGSAASLNTAFPVTTITLNPGDSAHAAMGFPEPGNFGTGVCSPSSINLKATPPNAASYLETPLVRQDCPGFSVTALQSGL